MGPGSICARSYDPLFIYVSDSAHHQVMAGYISLASLEVGQSYATYISLDSPLESIKITWSCIL